MYRVTVESSARKDIARIYEDLRRRSENPDYPDEWFEQIYARMGTLSDFPLRCSRSPEDEYFEEEVRQLLAGSYRVLFTVRAREVHVLHVRHGRREVLRPDELDR